MEGITKFKIHILSTVLKIGISDIPANENNQRAAPPLTTTSKIKTVGTIETVRYIAKISGMDCKRGILAPKNWSKLKNRKQKTRYRAIAKTIVLLFT